MAYIELNQENFNANIDNEKRILVDFWATWCGPCSIVGAILDMFCEDHSDVTVGKYCIDDDISVPEKYEVKSVPTIILFERGTIVKRHTGILSTEELEEFYYG